jgi:hypothetical protein
VVAVHAGVTEFKVSATTGAKAIAPAWQLKANGDLAAFFKARRKH